MIVETETIKGIKVYALILNNELYFKFIRTSELPEAIRKNFEKFLYGQTRPYFSDYEDAAFYTDYLRFERGKFRSDTPVID